MKTPQSPFRLQHWQIVSLLLVLYDAISITFAYTFALFLRFDLQASLMLENFGSSLVWFCTLYVPASLIVYYCLHLYNSIWQFASYTEIRNLVIATVCCAVLAPAISFVFSCRLPLSTYLIGLLLQLFFAASLRFAYRFVLLMRKARDASASSLPKHKTMIIGAGSAGQLLVRDARIAKESDLDVKCLIDDNPNKHHRHIDMVPVAGGRQDILQKVEEYEIETIVIAIPSATPEQRRDILHICQETDCEIRMLPSLIDSASGSARVNSLQKVRMEDLLGRQMTHIETEEIYNSVSGRTILVTGGGGSIGSELCRQIARHQPKRLIIVDIYENNAYEIQQELWRSHPELDLVVLIASVRDSDRIDAIFARYRPQMVYHAAAHKHVPLMESSPCESVKNNVFGTFNTAKAALKYGVERFVLISTDKAVNPTNIMGATKRLCEMIIQSFNENARNQEIFRIPVFASNSSVRNEWVPKASAPTQFVAVRFGNVLGSNGSVIPLFKKQIAEGGPVTVTHPDIVRYFMTISEAVSLVLEAGTYAKGGEIFVLDMGEPVKIDDLARNLIRLAGKTPGKDIEISYTGLRPGEKLYEEKLMAEEGLEKTANKLIHIGKPLKFDRQAFFDALPLLYETAMENDEKKLIEMVNDLVDGYSPDWKNFEANASFQDSPMPCHAA